MMDVTDSKWYIACPVAGDSGSREIITDAPQDCAKTSQSAIVFVFCWML